MLKLNDMGAIRVSRSDVWRSQLSHVWLGSCHSAPRHRDCGRTTINGKTNEKMR
jgi:hypothetical protein